MLQSWQKSIFEYLSPGKLARECDEEYLQGQFFAPSIERFRARDPAKVQDWAPLPGHDGIEFAVLGHHDAWLRDTATGKSIGGYEWVLPWLEPEYRGRGIMSALHKQADDVGQRFTTANYTINGLMTRAKTHGLHIEAALAAGETVPAHVLADYVIEDGKARLAEPMTRERYTQNFIPGSELERIFAERELALQLPEPNDDDIMAGP